MILLPNVIGFLACMLTLHLSTNYDLGPCRSVDLSCNLVTEAFSEGKDKPGIVKWLHATGPDLTPMLTCLSPVKLSGHG